MEPLKHVLSPLKIRSLGLPNRVVVPPMGTNLGNPDGTVSEANIAFLRRRARGGPGLVITEIVGVHPSGLTLPSQLCAFDDRFMPGLKRLAHAVHDEGCKVAMQLHHTGRESLFMLKQGKALGPSPIPSLIYRMPPREMTHEDIREIVAAFGTAARRAREAGFDGVEVHGAHGYLLTQFLSSLSNQRTDEYGGELRKRGRFVCEVLNEVRRQVGSDFPMSLRLSVEECIKGGYTAEDIQSVLPDFVNAGADVIHASFGTHGSPGGITSASIEHEPGFMARLARTVKAVVDVPVIAVGRFTDPSQAEAVIVRGDADLVAFGRQFLADPDFLVKTREGRPEDICRCLACNQGCIERLMMGEGNIRCAINPETGQETLYPRGKAAVPKRVWVVGGGPAGLTAALEASRLGHEVQLYEAQEETGGQIRYASRPPHKAAYGEWIEWLAVQATKQGVKIRTSTRVTETLLRDQRPEAVILATGGEKIVPTMEGMNLPLVSDAWQVLAGEVGAGRHVVVIGGGLIGMETADFLRAAGASVTVVEALKQSPVTTFTAHGYMLHKRLREGRCPLLFNTTVTRIEKDRVIIEREGEEQILEPVDQVVIAVGLRASDGLKQALEDLGIRHVVVGDARSPRRIMEATEEGARAAWELFS
jgi:2,4-dienoyl-CoA reductase-like NADH-dependent reductase (Old Yellow Enzyme family)/thioredoxin reductase